MRLRPERKDHVWSYDFVQARTRDGRASRMRTVIDEYTRECPAIVVARRLRPDDALERPSDLFVRRGAPGHIRSDNGPEFAAEAVRGRLGRAGVATLYIEPGSPREDGYIESFHGKLGAEPLDREVFDTPLEARALIERWRCGTTRPAPTAVRDIGRRRRRRSCHGRRPSGPRSSSRRLWPGRSGH